MQQQRHLKHLNMLVPWPKFVSTTPGCRLAVFMCFKELLFIKSLRPRVKRTLKSLDILYCSKLLKLLFAHSISARQLLGALQWIQELTLIILAQGALHNEAHSKQVRQKGPKWLMASVIQMPCSFVLRPSVMMSPALLTKISIWSNLDCTFFANSSTDFLRDKSKGNEITDPPAFLVISFTAS